MATQTRMTLDQARATAAEMDAERAALDEQYEWDKQQAAIENHYVKVPPGRLVIMWEIGTNEHGEPLSDFQFQALCAAWHETFGDLPPQIDCREASATIAGPDPEPMPADDAMLSPRDVVRVTGISLSTIKRMVNRGQFPQSLKISVRRIGWPAKDVYRWLEALHDQRRNAKRPH